MSNGFTEINGNEIVKTLTIITVLFAPVTVLGAI